VEYPLTHDLSQTQGPQSLKQMETPYLSVCERTDQPLLNRPSPDGTHHKDPLAPKILGVSRGPAMGFS
jgi:hypothetical protein